MKLVLQIALGVFLGALASQLTIDGWRNRQEGVAKEEAKKLRDEQEKVRLEQGRQGNAPGASERPPDFVPDDVQGP